MLTPTATDNPFQILFKHGVPFVIVGGYAVNFHGHPKTDVNELLATSVETSGIRFASRERLFAMKRAAGRSKDLDDIRALGGTP